MATEVARPANLNMLWLLVIPLGMIVVLVVGVGVPIERSVARIHWSQQQPQHYQMKIRWREGGWVAHNLLEVRDGRIAGGTDLFSGQPLSSVQLGVMRTMFPVEQLFAQVELLQRWPASWRAGLARSIPFAAARRVIDGCAVALPLVRYDPQLGYPNEIRAFPNPCYNGIGSDITVEELRILP